jgi:Transposase C of IS166 homeodomain
VQAGVNLLEEAHRYGIAARVLLVNSWLMDIDLVALPDYVETLQRMVRTLAIERANLTDAQAEIERLRLIVQKLQRSQFGRRAERLDDDQLHFGFEDLHADIARVEATLPSTTVRTLRSRPDRPSLPAHLVSPNSSATALHGAAHDQTAVESENRRAVSRI